MEWITIDSKRKPPFDEVVLLMFSDDRRAVAVRLESHEYKILALVKGIVTHSYDGICREKPTAYLRISV